MARAFDSPEAPILEEITRRKAAKQAEMTRFQGLCDRFDNLYYANIVAKDGGADHWNDDVTAKTPGQVHVSLNVYANYVDIPASLQSVEPVENILPLSDEGRGIAAAIERVYFAWKDDEDYELKAHKSCVVKGLYGRTAAKVWWDEGEGRPRVNVVDQPRNLWMGFRSQDYEKLDWVIYAYRISLDTAIEQYGMEVDMHELQEGTKKVRIPFFRAANDEILTTSITRASTRNWLTEDKYMVECVDYWYRKPKKGAAITPGEPTPMETWNAIFVGNFLVKDMPHPEYDGDLPYVPLFNSYLPGIPDGKSELYDIEQLVREKDERMSAGGQMIRKAIKGQMWQLTGQDAPDIVPTGVKPKEDTVVAPGAGNRLEKIEPFVPEFQWAQYMDRLDRELVDVSGLNDLLRGMAPAQVLSSSKAINALVANYEARIRMKRDLFYKWRRDTWKLAVKVWGNKNALMKQAFAMAGRLVTEAPSITPRDDLETATLAANMLAARIWSLSRAQDATGVDDPEGEQAQTRREQTDASLFPEKVLQQVSLLAALQQFGMQQQQLQAQAGPAPVSPEQAANAERQQAGLMQGQPMMNGVGEQPMTPPQALPPSGPGANFSAQTQVTSEGPSSRLLLEQPIAPEGGGGGY